MKIKSPVSGQRGVALLLALSLLVVVSTSALALFALMDFTIEQERNLKNMKTRQQVEDSLYQWGQQVLLSDFKKNAVDHLNETWAQRVPEIELGAFAKAFRNAKEPASPILGTEQMEQWFVSGGIEDVERFLNIGVLIFDVPEDLYLKQEEILFGLCNQTGANFLQVRQALERARTLMQEGLLPKTIQGLKALDRANFAKLAPYIVLLPTSFTGLNVNTTSDVLVRSALMKKVSPAAIAHLLQERERSYFKNINDLNQRMFKAGVGWNAAFAIPFATESSAFMVTVRLKDEHGVQENKRLFVRGPGVDPTRKVSEYKWIKLEV